MSITEQGTLEEPVENVVCPHCGSDGPFDVEVFVIYGGSGGRATRVEGTGSATWEWEPTGWDLCDDYDYASFTCVSCDEYFDLDLAVK